jgi:hypothetical protein
MVKVGFSQSDFQLGLKLSPNLSWLKPDTDGVESEGMKFGFNYGIVGDFNISENYAFSTGISIVNSGGKIVMPDVKEVSVNNTSNSLPGKTEADIRIKYVEIPLTLKLKTNQIGYMTYYGQFGFGAGVNYDSEADTDFTYNTGNSSATLSEEGVDYKDEINLLRASLIVGLGAEYNLSGSTSLTFGVTFNNGFTDVFSEDTYEPDANGNAQKPIKKQELKAINNYLVLDLGVLF